jgi:hypothetical protein
MKASALYRDRAEAIALCFAAIAEIIASLEAHTNLKKGCDK